MARGPGNGFDERVPLGLATIRMDFVTIVLNFKRT